MESIKLEKLEILLDNNKIHYQSGETISGTVNIKLLRSGQYIGVLDLSIVTIVMRAMSEVNWVENPATAHYKEGYIYRDSNQDMDVVYDIPNKISKTAITSGEHSVPFKFELPDKIPSSIDAQHGYIKYWIEVIINNEVWSPDVYHERKHFTVESPFRENISLSVGGGTEKDLGLLNVGSGKVRIDASLLKKGHTLGEMAEVHCLVTNTSTVVVIPRAHLIQIQIFMAKDRHKTVEYSFNAVVGEQVDSNQTTEQILSVQIPKNIPPSIKTRLISVKYFIHVTLDIPHANDLHINLPIILTNALVDIKFKFDKCV